MTARMMTGSALVVGLLAGTVGAGAAPANAATAVRTQQVAMNCLGVSPNIIDLPYNGGVRVQTRPDRPGTITLIGGSNSASRYLTDATITIRNLSARTSGTVSKKYLHTTGGSNAGGYTIPNIYTGPGRVEITVTATNHGLFTLTAPRCSGTALVR